MKKFLNCTVHSLTNDQIKRVKELFGNDIQIFNIRENHPDVFQKVSNINIDDDLEKIAEDIIDVMGQYDVIHLPIGSPAFMFVLSQKLQGKKILFSHSKRNVIEKINDDGTVAKTAVFQFVDFIQFNL